MSDRKAIITIAHSNVQTSLRHVNCKHVNHQQVTHLDTNQQTEQKRQDPRNNLYLYKQTRHYQLYIITTHLKLD